MTGRWTGGIFVSSMTAVFVVSVIIVSAFRFVGSLLRSASFGGALKLENLGIIFDVVSWKEITFVFRRICTWMGCSASLRPSFSAISLVITWWACRWSSFRQRFWRKRRGRINNISEFLSDEKLQSMPTPTSATPDSFKDAVIISLYLVDGVSRTPIFCILGLFQDSRTGALLKQTISIKPKVFASVFESYRQRFSFPPASYCMHRACIWLRWSYPMARVSPAVLVCKSLIFRRLRSNRQNWVSLIMDRRSILPRDPRNACPILVSVLLSSKIIAGYHLLLQVLTVMDCLRRYFISARLTFQQKPSGRDPNVRYFSKCNGARSSWVIFTLSQADRESNEDAKMAIASASGAAVTRKGSPMWDEALKTHSWDFSQKQVISKTRRHDEGIRYQFFK